ncbi:MAG: signal recognition particle-docking protein FtsY [Nitrospirae bacterium]|nr:signal recognition particle-docking protein FtsY [Nitrospirota bacterium]MBI3352005.1 signal recognition particle-docking protein FtsY [Nitrospirota bacterium]
MGLFDHLKKGLAKTRNQFLQTFGEIFLEEKPVDQETLHHLEEILIMSDMGAKTADRLMESLRPKIQKKELKDLTQLKSALKGEMKSLLSSRKEHAEVFKAPFTGFPRVILMIGVNGVGKTTSIGKLAHYFVKEGKSVLLAAGDTFRAAAIEQLVVWGDRNKIDVIAQKHGADPSAVAFDAYAAAKARKVDVLIVDTAGRLHTKSNLMEELKKIKKTLGKGDPSSPHEVLLVLDATQGQNALSQAKMFHEAIGVTGIILTKLDSTARGGIVIPIWSDLNIPIQWLGLGEKLDDFEAFEADAFIDALFSD